MTNLSPARRLGYLFAEILNGKQLDRFDELVVPGYVNHNPYAEPGLAGVKKLFGAILDGVPDLVVTAEDVFVSEDGTKVAGRYRYEGTHSGALFGCPATGHPFFMRSIDIWRVDGGRFAEHWDELNTLDIFQQIRAVKMTLA